MSTRYIVKLKSVESLIIQHWLEYQLKKFYVPIVRPQIGIVNAVD